MTHLVEADRLQALVAGAAIPVRVAWHAEIGSTNDECARLAREGAAEGLVVVADVQTAGRGRFERTWVSPPGNLYLSFLLRPEGAAARGPLGLVASLAVLDAMEELGSSLQPTAFSLFRDLSLKWPNDICCRGRKLCGILSVGGTDARGAPFAVVGIGVNLNAPPPGLDGIATTLAGAAGRSVDVTRFAAEVIRGLGTRCRRLGVEGFGPQVDEWADRSGWIGREVEVDAGGGRVFTGAVAGLGPGGSLLVRLPGGGVEEVLAADATLKVR